MIFNTEILSFLRQYKMATRERNGYSLAGGPWGLKESDIEQGEKKSQDMFCTLS